jgi:hypothetical protein
MHKPSSTVLPKVRIRLHEWLAAELLGGRFFNLLLKFCRYETPAKKISEEDNKKWGTGPLTNVKTGRRAAKWRVVGFTPEHPPFIRTV